MVFSLLIGYGFFGSVPVWLYVLFVVIWIAITAIGSFQIKMNYHLHSLNHNYNISENHISITFDDGPNPDFTPKILKLLKDKNAKATFFLVGKKVAQHPKIVQRILEEGHSIGNHSYSHSNGFGFFSTDKIVSELKETNTIINKLTGKEMKLFRPPFGVTNPNIKKALKVTKHHSIGWSKRSLDTAILSEETVYNRVTADLRKGDIILFHDNSKKTMVVLERLLLFLESHKLKTVPVEQLLEIRAYA